MVSQQSKTTSHNYNSNNKQHNYNNITNNNNITTNNTNTIIITTMNNNNLNCFNEMNVLLKVALHPIHSMKPIDAIKLQLNNILFKYHDHLNGIPLSYKHIKFPIGKEYARIFNDQSWLHVDVLTTFIVFTPVVDQVIWGKINKVIHIHSVIHSCSFYIIF